MDDEADQISILRAGINRFFDEGHYYWSKAAVESVLSPIDIRDPTVTEAIAEWSRRGYIRVNDNEECHFEVLRPIES